MFSDQFYEERLSVRERNMKLEYLLEAVTYIAIKEGVTCIIAMETVIVHNALQKVPPA